VSNIFPEIDLTPYGGELGGVSRQHAKIVHIGNQWSIVDLNSTNHTRVNGQRIEPQTPTPLSDGTKLQFGRLVATFHLS
jgi:pSer/pThr/pTyr-binding forkhead associated (FHA) protein